MICEVVAEPPQLCVTWLSGWVGGYSALILIYELSAI